MAAIEIKRVNARVVLTMNRPDQCNALDFAAATAEVRNDDSVRTMVHTGAGGHLRADFVLGSPRAKFCGVFAPLGDIPDTGATYLLPRAVGLTQNPELKEATIHD
ncbi:MAG: hypothetical protein K2Q97_14405 [Burkholderiaceae bacterium]|nr:hypothetical protein [Burkholderiaceae bacterium]